MNSSQHTPEFAAVIVGGGSGHRFGHPNKVLTPLAGKPLLWFSVESFANNPSCVQIIVVLGKHTIEAGYEMTGDIPHPSVIVVPGGETRRESVLAGLAAISGDCEYIAIHDAARPLFSSQLTSRLLAAAHKNGASIPTMPVTDTVHVVNSQNQITGTPARETLQAAQTPQFARRDWIVDSLQLGDDATDEAASLVASGYPVVSVRGEIENIKITWPEDIDRAESIILKRAHQL